MSLYYCQAAYHRKRLQQELQEAGRMPTPPPSPPSPNVRDGGYYRNLESYETNRLTLSRRLFVLSTLRGIWGRRHRKARQVYRSERLKTNTDYSFRSVRINIKYRSVWDFKSKMQSELLNLVVYWKSVRKIVWFSQAVYLALCYMNMELKPWG